MSHFCRIPAVVVLLFFVMFASGEGHSAPIPKDELRLIKVDSRAVKLVESELGWKSLDSTGKGGVYRLTAEQVEQLARLLHQERGRCGGFKDITLGELQAPKRHFPWISIQSSKASIVDELPDLLRDVSEARLRERIEHLSSYTTRKYSTQSGKEASAWIKARIEEMAAGRSDVTVELLDHSGERSGWVMPSVIAKILGSESPDVSVVIGGHLDSINWSYFSNDAPGADDDASGVASALEAFAVILESGVRPKSTIEFMAYSGEEVGLWGSQSIAKSYLAENRNVRGVMQLDMVLHPSQDEAIYLVSDHVDPALTEVVRQLGQEQLGFDVKLTKCGYACSDHASWSDAGYPSVFPFESAMGDSNPLIHTANDTLANAPAIDHATKYAKLGVAFLWELAYRR